LLQRRVHSELARHGFFEFAAATTPSPDSDHREVNVHKEVDKKGNTVIEKDIQREGVAGSTEIHKKIETDRDGTVTHSETEKKQE
jgi:hypothetical protein